MTKYIEIDVKASNSIGKIDIYITKKNRFNGTFYLGHDSSLWKKYQSRFILIRFKTEKIIHYHITLFEDENSININFTSSCIIYVSIVCVQKH